MSKRLLVGVAQFELRPEPSHREFLNHAEQAIDAAARQDADLVVLPELASTGLLASAPQADSLTKRDMQGAYEDVLSSYFDATAEAVSSWAKTKGLWILAGSHYRQADDGTYRNTAVLGSPEGTVDFQDKLHLTPPEKAIGTTPGERVEIITIGPARIAVQVCADIQFPEVSRYLALRDVTLLLNPTLTWNSRGMHRIRYAAHARAVENQLFVATSTLIGTCGVPSDGALHGVGRALITCPLDRLFGINNGVLSITHSTSEEIAVAELDFDLIEESRANPEPPGLSNIRPDLYRDLDHVVVESVGTATNEPQ